MFKKRLKGLLAMLLAGSIAATALPMSASATISGDVTIKGGDLDNSTVSVSDIGETSFTGGVLQNSDYLNANNMWAVTSYNEWSSGSVDVNVTVSGDKLAGLLYRYNESPDTYSYTDIKYSHEYVVTTDNPKTTTTNTNNAPTATTFPVNVSSPSPLKSITGYTVWYGVMSGSSVYSSAVVPAGVTETHLPPADSISIPMSTFEGLYTSSAGHNEWDRFNNGVTLIQVDTEYKTLDIPVKNALLRQETDSDGADRHISVSKDSESPLDEGDYYFYLCYYDEEQKSFKISDYAKKYEKDVWDVINEWVNEDPNLDTNKLFLCRKVTVNVNGNGVDSEFNTKDLLDYLIVNQGEDTTNVALRALLTAKPNSIWEVNPRFTENPPFYTYQKDAATSISDFLLEYPHEKRLNLFEQSSIRVTALDPKTNGEIEWGYFIESKLLDENGEPRKISDHFNDLFGAVPQEAGKKYDADGWQLWAGVTSCGGLYDFSKVELDKKPDSIGVTELNKMQNSITFVYFPQVEIAPSLEVTAPVAGETPSTECKILDELGGYSVDGVEWDCDYTLLVANDKFEAGKKYRVKIDLLPDGNLSFVDSTPVTINGKEAFETILDDAYFSVYQVFTTAPEKPVNVKATAGNGKVDLNWEDGEGAYGYNIYFYNKDGTLTEIARTQNNSYTVEKLEDGTKYGFVVRSVSAYGDESSYTAEDVVYATTVEHEPSKPENVKATAGDGQVTLSWNAVPNAITYYIYSYLGDGQYALLGATSDLSFTATGLTNGQEYQFLVRAFNKTGGSPYELSDLVAATPQAKGLAKPVLDVTVGDGAVYLSWSVIPDATLYYVYFYNSDTNGFDLYGATTGNGCYVGGLVNGQTYGYLVRAFNDNEGSPYSYDDIVFVTLPDNVAKPVFTATPGDGQVTLSWNAVPNAITYYIYSYLGDGQYALLGATSDLSFTATGLTNGQEYQFLVRAFNATDGSPYELTDLVSATPQAKGLAKPVLDITVGDGAVYVSWSVVPNATLYYVYFYNPTINGFDLYGVTTGNGCYVGGLVNGQTYGYLVRAFNDNEGSPYSYDDIVFVTLPANVAKPVFTATPGDGQVTLSWNAVPNAITYYIYSYLGDGQYALLGVTSDLSFTATGLTNGQEYQFLVRAFSDSGASPYELGDLVAATPA